MKQYKTLVIVGGVLLMLGAVTPWVTITGIFGLSKTLYGYEGDGLITGFVGLLLLLIGLLTVKETPGKSYSVPSVILSAIISTLILSKIVSVASALKDQPASVSASIGYGLLCLSPVGALLALVGGATSVPKTQVSALNNADAPATGTSATPATDSSPTKPRASIDQ